MHILAIKIDITNFCQNSLFKKIFPTYFILKKFSVNPKNEKQLQNYNIVFIIKAPVKGKPESTA